MSTSTRITRSKGESDGLSLPMRTRPTKKDTTSIRNGGTVLNTYFNAGEVHLKLKDETPFFVRSYPIREEQKKVIQKDMDRLEHLGIICKGLTDYSSLVVLVKWKNQNLYRVCSDFRILNEKLVKINHAFPLVRDCI